MNNTSGYRWPGRITRKVTTQPGGPMTQPVEVEEDVLTDIRFSWKKKKSDEIGRAHV